jgi:pyrophosphatase PpaX
MNLEAMIFDLDGTLGDTLPMCYAAFRAALGQFLGRRYSDAEIRALFGPSEEGVFQLLVPERWEECLAVFLAAYERAHQAHAASFPGVEQALATLKARGVTLGVVTGKGVHSAEISLRYLGLGRYFDGIEAGSAAGGVKPAAIGRLLAAWDVPAGRAAYVGDVPSDVDSARKAGVIPLAAAWAPGADVAALAARGPHALFHTVERFVEWIADNLKEEDTCGA